MRRNAMRRTGVLTVVVVALIATNTAFSTNAADTGSAAGAADVEALSDEAAERQAIVLDVEAALDRAVRNNILLQAEEITLRTKERAKKNNWNEFLPSVSLSSSLSRSEGNASTASVGESDSPWDLSVGITASLPLSSSLAYRIRATRIAWEAGEIGYEDAVRQLERDVKKAFYDLIVKREKIVLVEQSVETAKRRYEQEKTAYERGLVSELTMLNAQVSWESLKPTLEEAVVSYKTAEMEFRRILGLGLSADIVIDGSLDVSPLSFDAETLAAAHMEDRLDIRDLRNTLASLENEKKLVAAEEHAPTLSLSYSYSGSMDDPFHTAGGTSRLEEGRSTVGLALSFPLDGLIPGSSSRVKVKEAADAIDGTLLELQDALQQAAIEIETLVLQMEKSERTIAVLERSAALFEKTYDLTKREYDAGLEDILTLDEARDDLLEARIDVLQEKYTYLSALFDLEYALNTSLRAEEAAHLDG
jgi:outer membrane protein TolC